VRLLDAITRELDNSALERAKDMKEKVQDLIQWVMSDAGFAYTHFCLAFQIAGRNPRRCA
jgi:hypothetical protein